MSAPVYRWRHSAGELATRGEVIVAVGTAEDVTGALQQQGLRADRVIDLPGAAIIPGLVDAHIHTAQYARSLTRVDLRGAADLPEVLSRLLRHAEGLGPGEPLRGAGWEWQKWEPAVLPTRADLDAILPDRPVLLESQDLHTTWVNSALLRRVGMSDDPETPGILREAEGWEAARILGPEDRLLAEAMSGAIERLLSMGVTGVHDMDDESARAAFLELRRAGRLGLRVVQATRHDALDVAIVEGRRTGAGDPWFREGHIKVFTDGALGSLTCHVCAPFNGTDHTGLSSIDDADLAEVIETGQRHGLGVAAHAIGDRANQRLLDAYAAAAERRPAGLRHRVEHAQHLRPDDVARFAALEVIASVQPTHAISDMDLVDELFGDRPLASYPFATMWRLGTLLAFGSDAPVETPDPFLTLDAAVTRRRADGSPPGGWQPEEKLDPKVALWCHTVGPHRVAGQDDVLGRLAPGMLADFVVLDREFKDTAASRLSDIEVEMTVVGGEIRYSR
ncbi:amidohydrolase [Enemella sp. A6]|uniref:amidohydrolase n=1 Tax=Enemella sp. A6 TaxID=3440152 RepID=UPI003EB9ABE2